jgi:hypothetical protein
VAEPRKASSYKDPNLKTLLRCMVRERTPMHVLDQLLSFVFTVHDLRGHSRTTWALRGDTN